MRPRKPILLLALLALVLLYAIWFGRGVSGSGTQWAALLVFALPAAVMAVLVARNRVQAGLWSGVMALLWFAHGVMVAWTRAGESGFALLEIVLALVVVFAASIPGLRARFGRRRQQP